MEGYWEHRLSANVKFLRSEDVDVLKIYTGSELLTVVIEIIFTHILVIFYVISQVISTLEWIFPPMHYVVAG